ncbi:unnamed protein product [Dicrocoelium dendriticum]|nr:unnamed protein product [Dicrocoelium dendriticum]
MERSVLNGSSKIILSNFTPSKSELYRAAPVQLDRPLGKPVDWIQMANRPDPHLLNMMSLNVPDPSLHNSRSSSIAPSEFDRPNHVPIYHSHSSNLSKQSTPTGSIKRTRREQCTDCWSKSSICMKQFSKFLLSHAGLAILVVLYALLGGFLFYWLEQTCELHVKQNVTRRRAQLVDNLMQLWRDSQLEVLQSIQADTKAIMRLGAAHIDNTAEMRQKLGIDRSTGAFPEFGSLKIKSHADREKLLAGLTWYLAGVGWQRKIVPNWWFPGQFNVTTTPTDPNVERTTSTEFVSQQDSVDRTALLKAEYFSKEMLKNISDPLIILTNLNDLLPMIVDVTYRSEKRINELITNYIKHIVSAIKDDGWNGAENMEDMNWTLEGGILYAVTIITTIGYGHVTPHTTTGRLLTMLYAVFGIPLFFCYLTNNGNYFASAFQTCYIRMCRPVFRIIKRRCCYPLKGKKQTERKTSRTSRTSVSNKVGSSVQLPGSVFRITPKTSATEPTSVEFLPVWTDDRHAGRISNEDTHQYFNTYPISPSYRLTDDWEPFSTALTIDCYTNRPLHSVSAMLPSKDTSHTEVVQQPPSPYLTRSEQESENSDISISAFTPSSPVPLQSPSTTMTSRNVPLTRVHDRSEWITENETLKSKLDYTPITTRQPAVKSGLVERRRKSSHERGRPSQATALMLPLKFPPAPSQKQTDQVTVPITLTLCMMAVYILIGATVFTFWESRDYVKWSYFCFVTLSTIGFGDIVPGTKVDSQNPKEKMIILAVYMAVGLSVFAMCFKLMEEEVTMKMKRLGRKLGLIRPPGQKATQREREIQKQENEKEAAFNKIPVRLNS